MPFISGYMGKITCNLEIKMTRTGKQNCSFTIANDEGWGNSKRTDFIRCVAWEKTAQTIVNHFHKGDSIIVEGRWENHPWQKNEKGYDIPNWQFMVQKIHFLPKNKDSFAAGDNETFNPTAMAAVNDNVSIEYSDEFAPISGGADDEDLPW